MIASHYARPVERAVVAPTTLRTAPSEQAEAICELKPGEPFDLLDDSVGWAWGYGGRERRVGYVPNETLSRP